MIESTNGILLCQIGHFMTANQINCKYGFAVLDLMGFLWNYCVTGGDIIYWILCYSWLNSWYWMHLCIHHLLYSIIYASGSLLTRTTPCHAHSVFWHFHGWIKDSIKLYYNFCSSSGLKIFFNHALTLTGWIGAFSLNAVSLPSFSVFSSVLLPHM